MRSFTLLPVSMLLLSLFLLGCSAGWRNPDIQDKDLENRAFQRDNYLCEQASQNADYDRRLSTYEACMDAKGWVKKPR